MLLAPEARDDEDIPLLSELLSLPSSAADLNLSPQRKREKLFEALLTQLEAEARHRPVLMVFEDVHWIDPTSRELLDLTLERVRRLPVLLVITFRPEFQPSWGGRSQVTSLALNRLGERDGETLVQSLAGNTALTPDIVAEIVARSDGGAALCRGADQGGARKRRAGGPGCCGVVNDIAGRAVGAGDFACFADGAARSAGTGAQGDRTDRSPYSAASSPIN